MIQQAAFWRLHPPRRRKRAKPRSSKPLAEKTTNTRLTIRLAKVERDQLDAYALRLDVSTSEALVDVLYEHGIVKLLTPIERTRPAADRACAFCGRLAPETESAAMREFRKWQAWVGTDRADRIQ